MDGMCRQVRALPRLTEATPGLETGNPFITSGGGRTHGPARLTSLQRPSWALQHLRSVPVESLVVEGTVAHVASAV
jgi:hypothetical protein